MALKKILVLEDHKDSRRALSIMLQRAGYHIVEAGTVAEALAQVDGQHFALLDLHLPDGEGTVVCHEIRAHAPQTLVAFITASHEPEHTIRKKGVCPDAVFRKPLDIEKLMNWLKTSQ